MATIVGNRIIVRRGDDDIVHLAITRLDLPLNLTGGTVAFVLKKHNYDPDSEKILLKTSPVGILIINAAGGLADLKIAKADFNAVDNKEQLFEYVIKFENGAGDIVTAGTGELLLLPDYYPTDFTP